MVWFFLNLLILAAIVLLIFGLDVRFERGSRFFGGTADRIETVSRLIESETDQQGRDDRDETLRLYSEAYKVDFFLFDNKGVQFAGKPVTLPEAVYEDITRYEGFGPEPKPDNQPDMIGREPGDLRPPGPPPSVSFKTSNPTTYWLVIRTLTFNQGENEPVLSRLIVRSDSFSGHGLFFDPWPWVAVGGMIFIVSILFWLPFVRRITRSISQMKDAAEKIAGEDFSVRVNIGRTDELGGLGSSINDLAERLAGFVNGKKSFLGEISHELNSPLARMQFALSILEERVRAENQPHVGDVKEEVELMSKLVGELLSYSKSGIQGVAVKLQSVPLRPLVESVLDRESAPGRPAIEVAITNGIAAEGQPELLFRAIANVVRNSRDHSAETGKIVVSAHENGKHVVLAISDDGQGVPAEMLEKIFDPLFRVQDDRSRDTGGTGLGLAIVKTCVEACGGKVEARNLLPNGLAIVLTLNKPSFS